MKYYLFLLLFINSINGFTQNVKDLEKKAKGLIKTLSKQDSLEFRNNYLNKSEFKIILEEFKKKELERGNASEEIISPNVDSLFEITLLEFDRFYKEVDSTLLVNNIDYEKLEFDKFTYEVIKKDNSLLGTLANLTIYFNDSKNQYSFNHSVGLLNKKWISYSALEFNVINWEAVCECLADDYNIKFYCNKEIRIFEFIYEESNEKERKLLDDKLIPCKEEAKRIRNIAFEEKQRIREEKEHKELEQKVFEYCECYYYQTDSLTDDCKKKKKRFGRLLNSDYERTKEIYEILKECPEALIIFEEDEEEIDTGIIDISPGGPAQYPGGMEAFYKYINENKYYPNPKSNNIEGTVYVQFTVEKDGSITNVKLLRSLNPKYNQEAVRLVKEMPDWIPAKDAEGNNVSTKMKLPVKYEIQ